jgi:cytosine deaminase
MAATRVAKASFTVDDVYERALATLKCAILQGTTRIRTHVEVDPLVGLRSFEAVVALAEDFRWAVDVEICVFAQDGLTNNPGTEELLAEALGHGARAVGGAPYADTDPREHIDRVFKLARDFDVDVDMHLDLADSPEPRHAEYLAEVTERCGWEERVTIGHLTQWSLVPPEILARLVARLSVLGIGVTVLPATDLFLMGRAPSYAKPRGVLDLGELLARGGRASLATNNVLNAFTPYGDASLVRMANLYANVTHQATAEQLASCFELVSSNAAGLLGGAEYGLKIGNPADLVAFEATSAAQTIAELAPVRWVIKRGHQTVTRPEAAILLPE